MRHSLIVDTAVSESIAFQIASPFFKELCLNFDALKKVPANEISSSEIISTLSKVVKNRTGLNVTFNVANAQPQVTIPMVNKNNILINSFIREHLNSSDGLKLIGGANNTVRGSVNLKTGIVSGIFSEVHSTIDLPSTMFSGSYFSSEEIAAITLHEVGHLFVYYEFMARSVTTNQVLSGVSKGLDSSGTVEERELVLITAKKALKLTDLDTKALSKSNNKKVAEIVIISNIAKEVTSELGSNVYDFSTWEYLADQYSARHGAGRYLATGLEKIYKGSAHISFRSTPSYLAMEALKLLLIMGPLVLAATTGMVVGPVLLIGLLLVHSDSDNPTYDRPGERLKRIRNQIVENLKDRKLDKDDIAKLEADLTAIDIILKDVDDTRQWLGVVQDVLFSSNRSALKQERLQQELENLAVNELFVKAAMLQKATN